MTTWVCNSCDILSKQKLCIILLALAASSPWKVIGTGAIPGMVSLTCTDGPGSVAWLCGLEPVMFLGILGQYNLVGLQG